MHGDFSRWTFDPASGDRGVLSFQGRIVLDQDLNKQWDIADYLRRRRTTHIVGDCGAPEAEAGFALAPFGTGIGVAAGAYYVHGVLCENGETVGLEAQPHLPAGAPIVRLNNGSDVTMDAAPNGQYFAVLDRWTRLITPLQEPLLLETALGGADTAGAARTIWQVRLVRAGSLTADVHCDSAPPAWQDLINGTDGTFRARAQPSTTPDGPCVVEAGAGYRRVSNQLYRVEIHQGGPVGTATFKFSRENGSVATQWSASNGANLTVASIGRDRVRGFGPGDWVELIDDDRALQGLPGTMVRLLNAQDDILIIDPATADGPTDIASFGDNPIIRRWDGDGLQTVSVPGTNDGYLALEDGVEIGFEAGTTYATGDYVTIPARHEVNDIEWPRDPGTGDPLRLPPEGIEHAYCKLGILAKDGTWSVTDDCRTLFPPLTGLVTMDMLGGDGQEAAPNPLDPTTLVALPQPLRVGVSRGQTPLAGRRVRFTVVEGNGTLPGGVASMVATTDAAGVARADWAVDSGTASQRVEAELLDPGDNRRHLPISFSANLSTAAAVSYDPTNCPPLAGTDTVQEAIDALCEMTQGGCATYIVTPNMDWAALLTSLQPRENAHICFQRGRFEATGSVTMSGLGHIEISGCGEGTEIVVRRAERAIEAVDCLSFSLSNLSVSTPDGGGAIGAVQHLNGTITTTGCPDVTIENCALSCGANAERARTCLTIRPRNFDSGTRPTPLRSIRVINNRITAGYGQIGVLLTDAARVWVRDNEIGVARRPTGLTIDRLIANPVRRAAMVAQLVDRPLIESQSPIAGTRTLRGGAFTAYIPSSVPQAEWNAMMTASPPTEAQTANADAFQGYVSGLVQTATREPAQLPSYERQLGDLQVSIGDQAFGRLGQPVRESLLLRSPVTVQNFTESEPRATALVIDSQRLAFDSPISTRDWQNMMRAAPPDNVRSDRDLLLHARHLAERVVRDEVFRARFPSANAWFDSLTANIQPTGYQGVVIGGRTLGSADVSGNRIDGFTVAMQIGLSHSDPTRQAFDIASSITLRDNVIFLRLPIESQVAPFGLFVGNTERVRMDANEIRWATGRNDNMRYYEAVRIYGRMGPFVMFKDNMIDIAALALRMTHTGPTPARSDVQWLAADNWSRGGYQIPSAMLTRNNVVA